MTTKVEEVIKSLYKNEVAFAKNEKCIEKTSEHISRLILELNEAGEHLADLMAYEDDLKAQRVEIYEAVLEKGGDDGENE